MTVSKDKQQIAVILPKELVKLLDEIADKEFRTRSQQAAKIIGDYLINYSKTSEK
jgi:metal-responsive CopG/Arc/MetJ family transcriptional regulator